MCIIIISTDSEKVVGKAPRMLATGRRTARVALVWYSIVWVWVWYFRSGVNDQHGLLFGRFLRSKATAGSRFSRLYSRQRAKRSTTTNQDSGSKHSKTIHGNLHSSRLSRLHITLGTVEPVAACCQVDPLSHEGKRNGSVVGFVTGCRWVWGGVCDLACFLKLAWLSVWCVNLSRIDLSA